MNKMRRKELACLTNDIRMIKTQDDLECAIVTLEAIIDEEEVYYDGIPENLKYSQRAYTSEISIDSMKSALDLLNDIDCDDTDVKQILSQAIDFINEAKS